MVQVAQHDAQLLCTMTQMNRVAGEVPGSVLSCYVGSCQVCKMLTQHATVLQASVFHPGQESGRARH